MNEEFKESLNDFLEEKTYIVAFRSNYDSAREFNTELINYIKQLQNNWNELKKIVERMKEDRELKGDFERFTAYDFVLNKMQEIEDGNNE